MNGLWTNRSTANDFFKNALNSYWSSASKVDIAVAFFTDEEAIESMISKNSCRVRMVVRLGFPTKPSALRALINRKGIEIKHYSDSAFHPKLYIFDDKVALLGSANLTQKALHLNQEIMISIESKDPRFDELATLFSDYWDEAKDLTSESLVAYEESYKKHGKAISDNINRIDEKVQSKIGKVSFSDRVKDKPKKSSLNIQTTKQELVPINLRGIPVYGIPPQPDYRKIEKGREVKEIEVRINGRWNRFGSVSRLQSGLYRVKLRKSKTRETQIPDSGPDSDYCKIIRMRFDSQKEAEQIFEKYMRSFNRFSIRFLPFINRNVR